MALAERGNLTGAQNIEFPDWKKDSFLDIQEDVAEALESNKHVILYFHLAGCPYCTVMMRESFTESPYVEYLKQNFDLIELDVKGGREVAMDENTNISEGKLARKLKVFSTPTVLFLDQSGKIKLRLDGYRSQEDFKQALDFVKNKEYAKISFAKYLPSKRQARVYELIDNKHFIKTADLSSLGDRPVALLFEDTACVLCKEFHKKILQDKKIDKVLAGLDIVRLDVNSDKELIDFAGNKTTALELSEKYNMTYRPGLVFFNKGQEVARIGGMLKNFHNWIMFRYVAEAHFIQHPSWLDFLNAEQERILASGKDIDIWQ